MYQASDAARLRGRGRISPATLPCTSLLCLQLCDIRSGILRPNGVDYQVRRNLRSSSTISSMRKLIPAHLLGVVADVVADAETHASMDRLFSYAGVPGDPPSGSKPSKALEWLRRINREEELVPLEILGRLLEAYMEADTNDPSYGGLHSERKVKIERALARVELQYHRGGLVTGNLGTPSQTLEQLIRGRDLPAIEEEFARALRSVDSSPKEAVSAACNILESLCKTYIEDEGLQMPSKQDLRQVWDVVRKHLGFDPSSIEDRDLKEIISGLLGVVGGIAALRTHASSAHGAGRRRYRLEPRHARLAIHSAHTLATFVLETWDKRRGQTAA